MRVTEDEGISTMQKDPTSAVYVPLRVKEIGKCWTSILGIEVTVLVRYPDFRG